MTNYENTRPCSCIANHSDCNEGVPGCFFSKEDTYDCSIEALARDAGVMK